MQAIFDVLSGWIPVDSWPRIACPACSTGVLLFKKERSFPDAESRELMRIYGMNQGPREEQSGTFLGYAACTNTRCGHVSAVAGEWQDSLEFDDDVYRDRFIEMYRVRFIDPALPLLSCPQRTPEPVREAVAAASAVALVHTDSAANLLRQAVERLLDAQGVRKTSVGKKGKRVRLKTHDRILKFASSNADAADALEAVKWIGNSGSHESQLTLGQVLAGAEYLSLALRILYDRSDAEVLKRAREVNRRKRAV